MSYSTPASSLAIASSQLDDALVEYFGSTGEARALKRHMLRRDVAAFREIANTDARKITAGLWEWAFKAASQHGRRAVA